MSEKSTETKPESAGQAEVKERDLKLEAAQQRVTAESKAIAEDIAKQDLAAGQKFLKLGEKCWKFLQRAKAAGYLVKDARGMLEADILEATRVNWSKEITRAIKVYHVHTHFGETALGLPLDMVKALSTFIQEDGKTGEWGIVPKHEDAIGKLYSRVVNGKGKRITAEEFRGELNRITNPNGAGRGKEGTGSPAGEKGADLGRPPIETPSGLSPLVGAKTNPGNTAVAILKTLSQSENEVASCHAVGQKIDHDLLVELFAGFCEGLLQCEDRVQAEADWRFVRSELESRFIKLEQAFPIKSRRSA